MSVWLPIPAIRLRLFQRDLQSAYDKVKIYIAGT